MSRKLHPFSCWIKNGRVPRHNEKQLEELKKGFPYGMAQISFRVVDGYGGYWHQGARISLSRRQQQRRSA